MHDNQIRNSDREIVVDPNSIELDAEWRAISRWARFLAWVLGKCRNQTAPLAFLTIIAIVKIVGVTASDPLVITTALVSIVVIAVATEWITCK